MVYQFDINRTIDTLVDLKYGHSDGTLVLVDRNRISFYNISDGFVTSQIVYAPDELKFFSNGWIACRKNTSSDITEITVWNKSERTQLHMFPILSDKKIISLHALNNLNTIATGNADGLLVIWNLNGSIQMQSGYHQKGILQIEQLQNELLITASYDGYIGLWDISNDNPLSVILPLDWQTIQAMTEVSNNQIVVGGQNSYIVFVQIFPSSWIMSIVKVVPLSCNQVVSLTLINNNLLALGGDDNSIYIYNMTNSILKSTAINAGNILFVVALGK